MQYDAPLYMYMQYTGQCLCGGAQHSAQQELLLLANDKQHLTVVNDLASVCIDTLAISVVLQ